LAKLLNPYELELIFPKSKFQRNIIIPEHFKTARYNFIEDKVYFMDYTSGRLSSFAQLRFLIQKHENIINLSEKYDRNTFKAIIGRLGRLNLLSAYNKNLSAKFQTCLKELSNLLLEFKQMHLEKDIEK
jgi:hypothetical protein